MRFTVRAMIGAVVVVAIVLGIAAAALRWWLYPHITFTVFNESSTPAYALRVTFLKGERTAEELKPGGVATSNIQSGGDAGIFFSYQDSNGVLRKIEPVYYESGNRGYLEVHITNEGQHVVNGIYAFDTDSIWTFHVTESGQMVVK